VQKINPVIDLKDFEQSRRLPELLLVLRPLILVSFLLRHPEVFRILPLPPQMFYAENPVYLFRFFQILHAQLHNLLILR
jgi:hypothetical protein